MGVMKRIATKRMLEGKSNAQIDLPRWIRVLEGCKDTIDKTSASKDIIDELSFDIEGDNS